VHLDHDPRQLEIRPNENIDVERTGDLERGRKGRVARTVTLKVRYDDFTTITRSDTQAATNDSDDIARRAVALLDKTEAGRRPVRLLGAGVSGFVEGDEAAEPAAPDETLLPFDSSDGT
jgi:DNA polymerase-4